jgi:hypothetical protein
MGQFSVEKTGLPGSVLSGNQQHSSHVARLVGTEQGDTDRNRVAKAWLLNRSSHHVGGDLPHEHCRFAFVPLVNNHIRYILHPNFLDGNMMTERGDVHHHGGRATLFLGYAVAQGVWLTEPSRDERHRNAGPVFKKHTA